MAPFGALPIRNAFILPLFTKGWAEGFLLLALTSGLIREGQYDSTLFFSLDCFTMSQDDGEHRIFPTQPILGLTIRNTQRLCLCSFPLVALRSPLFFVVDSLRRLSVSAYKIKCVLRSELSITYFLLNIPHIKSEIVNHINLYQPFGELPSFLRNLPILIFLAEYVVVHLFRGRK